jgi:hypothetical protein
MRTPTAIPQRGQRRERPNPLDKLSTANTKTNKTSGPPGPGTIALKYYPRTYQHQTSNGRVKSQIRRAISPYIRRAFTPLIDAKAASTLLGVPYTWLLAQARVGTSPTTASATTSASTLTTSKHGYAKNESSHMAQDGEDEGRAMRSLMDGASEPLNRAARAPCPDHPARRSCRSAHRH